MRRLMIVSLALLLVMIGVILWVYKLSADLQKAQDELRKTYEKRVAELRDTDTSYPWKPPARLDPVRFAAYLAVRHRVAEERQAQIDAPKEGTLTARRRRNELLGVLRDALDEQRMGLAEYRALGVRWQAVLAQDGPFDLRKAWNDAAAEYNDAMSQVTVPDRKPARIELPPPATDATRAERDLVRTHGKELASTVLVDQLGPLLDAIASGDA